jgi:TrbC/VIRB2 pilin
MTHDHFKTLSAVPKQKWLALAVLMVTAVFMVEPAFAQTLAPVVNISNLIRNTMVAVCLAMLTIAWGMAGYKMMFNGASVRDVGGPILGGAVAGSAAAMAALFIP